MLKKQEKRIRRHKKIRAKIIGTRKIPRLYVFRSNKHIYVQLINDKKNETVLALSDFMVKKMKAKKTKGTVQDGKLNPDSKIRKIKDDKNERKGKVAVAYEVGQLLARAAIKNKIQKVIFDRGGYKYHGRVKAIAEGARHSGLKF